jgi:hypothetical protein
VLRSKQYRSSTRYFSSHVHQSSMRYSYAQIRRGFDDHLYSLVETLASVIDFEESKFQGRLCIKFGVNPELDELRDNYENLDEILVRYLNIWSAANNISDAFGQGRDDQTFASTRYVPDNSILSSG